MAKKSISEPTFDETRDRWKVNLPAGLSPDGKRVRSWHRTREAARSYVAGITGKNAPAAVIPPRLAMQADEARAILEPHGRGLVDAARELAGVLEALAGVGTPLAAAKAYRAAHVQRTASNRFGDAVEAFLLTRDGLREDTLRGYRHHLKNILLPLHDKILSDVDAAEVNGILSKRPPAARKAAQVTFGTFMRWAASPPRGWCDAKVVEALDPVRVARDTEIETLDADEVTALLRAAEKTSPGCAIGFAVAVFGGVRLRELERLTWADISADHIEVGASVAKRHARRLVPLCPTLKAWVAEYRGDAEDGAPIVGPNWVNTFKTARRKAGWNVATQPPLKDAGDPARGAWQQNCLRHTCASIQVAIGKPLDELIFAFGHSGGTQMLKQHYLGRMTRAGALAILAIGPKGRKIRNIRAVA